jgi:hypothetical protein
VISSPWSILLLGFGPAGGGTLVTLGFGSGTVPVVVPAMEGVDWSLMYRPALALAASNVGSVNPDPAFGLTPTVGTPPGTYDWTRRGGED